MIFKQTVGTEDIYLGMGAKNPTTSSCENIVVRLAISAGSSLTSSIRLFPYQVKIKLPGADIGKVDLDVTDKFLDCRTPKWQVLYKWWAVADQTK